MEEFDTPDPAYVKGFNEGYLMAEHAPSLAEKLSKVKSDSQRQKGFNDGRSQFSLEKLRQLRPDRFKGDRPTPPKAQPASSRKKGYGKDI